MLLWRISGHNTLEGLGGELGSARWHTAAGGKRIVYLAEHPALALIESLVNFRGDPALAPKAYQLIKVEASARLVSETVDADKLPSDWRSDLANSQALGDAWLAALSSALLRIPSVPSPESWNYLLNPRHPDASHIEIAWCRWISYDSRLFGLREKR